MERTITVKDTGAVSVRPDMTETIVSLKSPDRDYEKAMKIAEGKLDSLQGALALAGFQKQDMKAIGYK